MGFDSWLAHSVEVLFCENIKTYIYPPKRNAKYCARIFSFYHCLIMSIANANLENMEKAHK